MGRPIDAFIGQHADDTVANTYIASKGWTAQEGWLYYSTGDSAMKMWDGSAWTELGGGGAAGLDTKSGTLIPGDFSGSPPTASVTFTTAFSSSSYSVTFGTETVNDRTYSLTAENKTTTGFDVVLGSSNIANLVRVGWHAIVEGES
jgi:hypothetical protein